jgi:hypothetical protein
MPQIGSFHGMDSPLEKNKKQDSTKVLSGSITMKYSKYKINQGIEDTFFEEEEPE